MTISLTLGIPLIAAGCRQRRPFYPCDKGMNKVWISALLWLAVVLSAHGASAVIPITPRSLDGYGEPFVFAVTSRPAKNGQSFHVTITAKTGGVPADSRVDLCFFRRTNNSKYTEPATPQTQVAVKKGHHVWKAHFVASKELLSDPDTAFVFSIHYHDGPAADFYVLRLRDFIKREIVHPGTGAFDYHPRMG